MKLIQLSIVMLLTALTSCQSQPGKIVTLDALSFSQKLKENPGSMILDVRTAGEFSGGYIPKAVNVDINTGAFQMYVDKLDKKKTYFVYCLGGGRSRSAAEYMRKSGFTSVFDLRGGIMAWTGQNLPIETPSTTVAKKASITMEEYQKMINAHKKVLIDFYAPWCAPCRKMEPMLNELAIQYKGKVEIIRINVDEQKQLAVQLGIDEIPVLKFYKDGVIKQNFVGLTAKAELEKQFK
ncbi:MAG: thioredoxin domain-containing protein [Bacteroidia bacterium]|jgi:thioredoxin